MLLNINRLLRKRAEIPRLILLSLCFSLLVQAARAQTTIDTVSSPADSKLNRSRGLNMLDEIKDVIKKEYYDPTFRGIDLDARFKTAAERIKKLEANSAIFRVIAQVLLDFNDSHTRFLPPARAMIIEYGFSLQMIGDECYVTDVKKGSDAEAKGVKPGDIVAKINGYTPTRANLGTIMYLMYQLSPQEKLNLAFKGMEGAERQLVVQAKLKTMEEVYKERVKRKSDEKLQPFKCKEVSAETIACKLYTFSVEKDQIDKMMKEVAGHKHFILDLRGNRGGYVSIELYLTGYFFDRDVKVGDEVQRKKIKERVAKSVKGKTFGGDLLVLLDSNSASASEVFSRVIQIEKRGKIVGDVSAGAVMTSMFHVMSNSRGDWSFGKWSFFGVNVTVGDLVMSDGNRLEGVGVIPDKPVGPTSSALLQRDDPVLAYAASLFGAKLTPEQAREFHFITNRFENDDDDDAGDAGDN
jgi:C-terminal processing protease CtpA/Prc